MSDAPNLPSIKTVVYVRIRRGAVVESYTPSNIYPDVCAKVIAELVADARRWGDTVEVRPAGEG